MGEVELQPENNLLIVHSSLFFYGKEATAELCFQVAKDIENHWNEPNGTATVQDTLYRVVFQLEGFYTPQLMAETIYRNTNPRNNFFRIEKYAYGNISFVDGLGSNTGYFMLENLLNNSTTAAHEFGHTLGLAHPSELDIRGYGQPSIMYPRGTLVDSEFQYDPLIAAGLKGGTINPFTRKVIQKDIDGLKLPSLHFSKEGFAVLGGFSNVWHDEQSL